MQDLIGNIFIYGVLSLLFLSIFFLIFCTIQSSRPYLSLKKYKYIQPLIDMIVGFVLSCIYIMFFYLNVFVQQDVSYKFTLILSLIVILPTLIYIKPYAGLG
jgi:hypothetical protein